MISSQSNMSLEAIAASEEAKARIADTFFETVLYQRIRERIFKVLQARESQMRRGMFEQKGVCLIGAPGSGKSKMIAAAIREFEQAAEASGGHKYGHKIVSVIVPGKASVRDTCRAILKELGCPVNERSSEDYLFSYLREQLPHRRIAAIHLDEVQDAGRYTTTETMKGFSKRFRNLMQVPPWPVCLILTSTLEGREFVNHDGTLARRLKPIEILPMTPATDGAELKKSLDKLFEKAGLTDNGLSSVPEFMAIFMHAAAYRFGVAIEIAIDAIGGALSDDGGFIGLEHFTDAYFDRTDCDEELNPFVSEHWHAIDTTRLMDRISEERKEALKKTKRK